MKTLGDHYENAAAELLERAGLQLLQRNYRCKAGEIDIVARDGDTLVFVEVRARRSSRFGGAAATIDVRKQRRVRTAALHFLQRRRQSNSQACRFDVITFEPRQSGAAATPLWIRSAFTG
jgi:putative endonuclease